MLSIAAEDGTDIGALKTGALQALAKDYRSGFHWPKIRSKTPSLICWLA